ncbi:MAG: FG-GAP-like repeat-containing protein [Verrucomicrobiota bacterium]|jgi:hypothetical protein|nr:FG-GAP-like repeat-containing protein [Verrucomicrobiota bacterium]
MKACLCLLFLLSTLVSAAPSVKVTPLSVPEKGRPGYQRLKANNTGLVPQGLFKAIKGEPVRDTGNSGLAAGDIDGDGWPDLYVCGMDGPNALYLNKGDWEFEDITQRAGVACEGWRLSGALFADVEGDGDLDLILTSLRDTKNFLFINDGKGKFTESLDIRWVYNQRGGSVSSSMADVDGDGDLDLYVTSFKKQFLNKELGKKEVARIETLGAAAQQANREMPKEWRKYFIFGKQPVAPGKIELRTYPGHLPDQLYLNDGQGNFRPVTDAEGRFRDHQGRRIAMPWDPSHEAAFRDVDGDGDPDLYVCADFNDYSDQFWINDGGGNFKLTNPLALRRTSAFSMGIDFTDLNRDGHLDFITVDMLSRSHKRRKTQMGFMRTTEIGIGLIENRPQIMQNTLHLNRGDGTWAEVAQYSGLEASEWSWGVVFSDVDLDGYEDLLVATGMIRDFMDGDTFARVKKEDPQDIKNLALTSSWFPKLPTQNMAYRNKGDLTFEFVSTDWGFDTKAVSGGLAQADFDGDGDLDVIFNNLGPDPLEIYRNESNKPRVAVRLIGKGPNTQGIGAKVRLIGGPGGPAPIEQEIHCGGGYASGSDTLAVFGTGKKTEKLKLEIIWRNRSQLNRRVIHNVKPNNLYEIYEGEDEPYIPPIPEEKEILFVDVMGKLDIPHPQDPSVSARLSHGETPFDDFTYQSLLPNRLSQLGPGVAWTDLNEDGFEDLVIGAGRGSSLLVYHGQKDGRFNLVDHRLLPLADLDQTGVIGWTAKPGAPILLVGYSNYEAPSKAFVQSPSVRGFNSEEQFTTSLSLPGHRSTTGPMAVTDVDGDGDLDLFIGGRMVPARYPEPADSQIFLNVDGNLKLDSTNSKVLEKLGLVSSAVFGDLDGDGDADLVLALEWGPVKVLRNDSGKFTDATQEFGLDSHQGWWNSVAIGDFDSDGRLDIVAGNWGRNSKYERSYNDKQPLRMAYSDFNKDGELDIVEYHFDKLTGKMVPERGRSCTMNAMPFIGEQNKSFELFGSRSLKEIYGECLKEGTELKANTLTHTVFLNRDGKFEVRALPIESQFAPVFGINVADFDGDGHEDIFVAHNFFASQSETPRSDGGRGLLMRGNGKGDFVSMAGMDSGIKIYGEQRGSAVADFNHDGRPDLVVTQNGSHTRLYQNAQARPGLRVKANAGPANPTGVGAIVRLKFAEGGMGPARLITAGSGYWSQDSAVQVLATPEPHTHVEIRWPNGETTITATPQGTKEISIGPGGKLLIPGK